MTSKQLSALGGALLVGVAVALYGSGMGCSTPPAVSADGGSCGSQGVCEPGVTEPCGNCGTATCNPCGQWGTCADQGICKPGDVGPDGCYEGETATCNASCEWVCP
jgi:hypothetical protein